MEPFGISVFDLGVLAILALAGLIGLVTGFIRGGLFLAAWILAVLLTPLTYPAVEPIAAEFVGAGWKATLAAAGATFLGYLVVLLLVAHLLGRLLRFSRLNMLDRSLGLLAGGLVAVGVLAVLYLPFSSNFPIDDYPWIRDARTRPMIERASTVVLQVIPERWRPADAELSPETSAAQQLRRLTAAPPVADGVAGDADRGYSEAVRDQLDREIADQQ